ncbi:MAG: type II toxin-antitoxin system RelE/ParE family toxin [Planctomycetia bacterium]|nr:type II toxin-antitoxin system RelE/ParE family toxin [Planctomycetia bacterium]
MTARAKDDLRSAFERAQEHAPVTARNWLRRFKKALQTLSARPRHCGLAPENALVDYELRQLLFGRGRRIYRALFTIVEDEVWVVHIRWGGMDLATAQDLIP